MGLSIGIGAGQCLNLGIAGAPPPIPQAPPPPPQETAIDVVVLPDNTLEIVHDTPDEIAITVSGSAPHDGTYMLDPADLAGGPVNLAPPEIAGTPAVGGTLTAVPGLWAYDGAEGSPAISRQWRRDGADIAGETAPTHAVAADDRGTTLDLVETATGATGSRQTAGPPVAIP